MSLFVDKLGREWDLRITISLVDPLAAVGLDLEALTEKNHEETLSKIAKPRQLGKVLWTILDKQAREKKVELQDFLDGLDGPTIHSALLKLVEAIMDFSQPPSVAKASKELLADRVTRGNQKQATKIRTAIGGGLSDGDGDSEELSDSTLAVLPSASSD